MTCIYIKSDGNPCGAHPITNSEYCFSHDPEHTEERRLAVTKGGLSPKRIYLSNDENVVLENAGDAKRFLSRVISDVWKGVIPATPVANTLGFLVRCFLDAYEKSEVEERLDKIEKQIEEMN